MTTSDEKTLNRLVKKITIIGGIITVCASLFIALGVSYGFIYKTENDIEKNTQELVRVNQNLSVLNQSRLEDEEFKGSSKADRENIKEQLRKIENQNSQMLQMISSFIIENSKK